MLPLSSGKHFLIRFPNLWLTYVKLVAHCAVRRGCARFHSTRWEMALRTTGDSLPAPTLALVQPRFFPRYECGSSVDSSEGLIAQATRAHGHSAFEACAVRKW